MLQEFFSLSMFSIELMFTGLDLEQFIDSKLYGPFVPLNLCVTPVCSEATLLFPGVEHRFQSSSTAPSPIDPVLTVQPDHCYIFFSLKSTFKYYFINYHNIIHLSLVRRIRQTLKTKPLIMLLYNYNLLIQRIPIQQP